MSDLAELDDFYGPNAGYVLDLFERFQQDPDAVDPATRAALEKLPPDWTPQAPLLSSSPALGGAETKTPPMDVMKIVGAARVARLVREMGHLTSHVDPLGSEPPGDPGLELSTHDITTDDLAALTPDVVGGPLAEGAKNALEALGRLRQAYSGPIGYENDHIQNPDERAWMREAAESRRYFQDFGPEDQRLLLRRLTEVETFEKFLHQTFVGAKRFSIEGTDMLVPMLDRIIHEAGLSETHEIVMGMAHRGRLNVLTHILGKPYSAVMQEFQSAKQDESASVAGTGSYGYTGDVKYHLGARKEYAEDGMDKMPITLTPNPSHLEFVDPVVEGRARAAQEDRAERGAPVQNPLASLAILIHGDSAFPGQGIVPETLNLSRLPGYAVGGTIHIITNNQVGFTTMPRDARSTLYASDLAKGFEIPIVHVNADDPEACIAAARMAFDYREQFGKDFLIDLIGYRRWGHNEGEEPAYTQPRMYEQIRKHPTVREIWAKTLEKQGVVTRDEAGAMIARVTEQLQEARTTPSGKGLAKGSPAPENAVALAKNAKTNVPAEVLTKLNDALLTRPEGFTANAKLDRLILQPRRDALTTPGGIRWAHAETLAFASILADGVPIRLSGQDSQPGTFSQRHLVLHDPTTGETYCPLQALPQAQASFTALNSPLSENAVLGFEYGYSMHATTCLVLWEAQFGDFFNGAQVIIDQFLTSGNAKWQQTPSLVLLLPHGYEGQGPEHSSARLERFLQLAAGDNMSVAYCSTAAQYFHVLRRQAALLGSAPRPLVLMTPKGLLKVDKPPVGSSLSDLAEGKFQPVLDDPRPRSRATVTRLVLCSGKVYVDMTAHKDYDNASGVAIARLEELYPFPLAELERVLESYPNLREVVWMQEEPKNMGAWTYVAPRIYGMLPKSISFLYVGRPEAASPAEGSSRRHSVEQNRLLTNALGDIPTKKQAKEPDQKEPDLNSDLNGAAPNGAASKRSAPAHAR